MHDSLPTGDLTELLGAPSSACDPVAADRAGPMSYDPDHAVQPLSSGLDRDAPYHLVVVGGQEVPVGYGGWSGPNWTETIRRWLSGTTESTVPNQSSHRGLDEDFSASENERKPQDIASPTSPKAAHRAYLEAQSSETLVLAEDVVDTRDHIRSPVLEGSQSERAGRILHREGRPETTAFANQLLSPGDTSYSRTPASLSSIKMGRSGSSSTTDTDRSACTDAKSELSVKGAPYEVTNVDQAVVPLPAEEAQAPYILVAKERLMGIYCSLWVHRSCAHLVQASSTGTVTAGLLAGKLGNKGAACISLKIVDTRFLFVCAHLAAHSEKSALRQANVKKIKEELVIDTFLEDSDGKAKPPLRRGLSMSRPLLDKEKDKDKNAKGFSSTAQADNFAIGRSSRAGQDITDLFDHTFWFGDLNFRLDISRLHADFLIKEKKFDTALTFDQLQPILKDPNGCFGGFSEAPINFAPSYKYDVLKLKRSRTVQRAGSAATGLGMIMSEGRSQSNAFASPTALTSLNASRTNLAADVVAEEEEEDDHSIADRTTLGSSRVSISSAFSGLEESMLGGDHAPDIETLANTHYNNRSSAAFFGSSLPSTPTTEKVIEKAKGLFNLMRARSPTHSGHSDADPRAVSRLETSDPPLRRSMHSNLLSPTAEKPPFDAYRGPDVTHASTHAHVPGAEALSRSSLSHPKSSEEKHEQTGPMELPKQSLEVPDGNRVAPADPTRSSTPLLSPRPRLKSMRSANTVLSVSSFGLGKSVSSTGQEQASQDPTEDATYDTSSKKRVQSWTDRILFKSNIIIEGDAEDFPAHRSLLSGTFLPSLLSMGKDVHDRKSDLAPTRTMSRISANAGDLPGHNDPSRSFGTAIDTNYDALNMAQNPSTPSLSGPQQRLNGRIAALFRRRSSDKRSSPGRRASAQEFDIIKSADKSPLKVHTLGLNHEIPNTISSKAPQSSHRTSVGPNNASITADLIQTADINLELTRGEKAKPHRAYTAPLPDGHAQTSSYVSGVLHLEATTPQCSSSSQPADQPLPSKSRSATFASTEMQRHGSEPLPTSLKSGETASPAENDASPYVPSSAHSSRRSSSKGIPFSLFHYKDEISPLPLASPNGHKHSRAAKTGISIPPSKTTPVTSESQQAEEKPHARLRHWWNARMLPHIFPFHSEIQPPEDDVTTQVSPQASAIDPPGPTVIGPRRGEVQCIYYDSISDLRRMEACSDHRPVVAVFAIGI